MANVVPTPTTVHQAISGFYSSGPAWIRTLGNFPRVRDYISSLSWEEQYRIGLELWQHAMSSGGQISQQAAQHIIGPIEMGNRTINYYEFSDREPDWAKFKQMFKRNVSKYNVPFFEADSEAEGEFVRFCQGSNLAPHKKTIIEYDGKGTDADKFLFLCLKDDDGACISEGGQGFLDSSAACPGGGPFGSCGRGARQVDKVLVKPEGVQQVTTLGLLTCRNPNVPRVFLASSMVGEALKKAGASGCEIIPTDNPNCCQLRITSETAGPARIGQARMGKRCPICGTAKMFIGRSERYFHNGDLKPTDFQICRVYAADNVAQFEILNGFPIVSQRIFNLLLDLKIKGLARYSTDPPVQHAVVQFGEV